MKISLNSVKEYVGSDIIGDVDELLHKIGTKLGAVESVEDYANRYADIKVARVVDCQKHPNADKLSVCQIDAGTGENIQVVCGAPNVRTGLLVAWIPPGATVPATYDKDPFVLEARELRGVVSNGMLASANELGIGDDHDGILEIEEDVQPGIDFVELYGLNDVIIELENKMFTHRPDCFGAMGVAREFAGIYNHNFETPDWYQKIPKIFLKSSESQDFNNLKLEAKNEVSELVPRFMAVAMNGVNVAPSPLRVQALLTRVGIKPINNIVDITNHLSYLTGQPLHAYDYDKVKALSGGQATLVVRRAISGDKLRLLNGKEIEPAEGTILITTDKEPVAIAGVMGGTSTEVDENTKNIIIECANFDMYSIRRASMIHGLFTDAVTRFTKGQSPLQNDRVIVKMMEDTKQVAGGSQASNIIDLRSFDEQIYLDQSVYRPVVVTTEFINSRLGLELTSEEIKTLLRNVGFACLEEGDLGEIEFCAPFWRTDIAIKEDILEEVGRLYGYDRLPYSLPKKDVNPAEVDTYLTLKQELREMLAAFGANELLTYSFVHGDLLKSANQDEAQAYKITNALSPSLQYYRLSLTPSLLSNVHQNIKLGYDRFALFELNKVHRKIGNDGQIPDEQNSLALVFASKQGEVGYYQARTFLDELAKKYGLKLQYQAISEDLTDSKYGPFDQNRSALVSVDGQTLGIIGEFSPNITKKLKLPKACAGFEIDLAVLVKAIQNSDVEYRPISRYPSVTQDVCFELDKGKTYGQINLAIDEAIGQASPEDISVNYQLIDAYGDDKIGDKKRLTFRMVFNCTDHTLTEDIVNKITGEIAELVSRSVQAKRI